MEEILIRSVGFIFIIALGYILKKVKFFGENEYRTISKMVINITLPAVIISSFMDFKGDKSLIIAIFVSLVIGVILLFIGIILSKKKNDATKILYIINFPGYNIGNFTLPFVQNVLGSFGVVATCMFDIGNAMMVTGVSYVIATSLTSSGEKRTAKDVIKQIFSSAPLVTYLVMSLVIIFHIKLPAIIGVTTGIIARGNSFFSMFLIGLMFDIKLKKEYFKNSFIIIVIRYFVATVAAFIIYKFLPVSMELRRVLMILVFSPLTSLSPIFTEKAGGNKELSSFIGACSIVISIIIIIFMINYMSV